MPFTALALSLPMRLFALVIGIADPGWPYSSHSSERRRHESWRLILHIASGLEESRNIDALKKSVTTLLRMEETYEVKCPGVRMFGIDFLAENDELNHVMSLVKILKERYWISIMRFSKLREGSETGVTIRVGSQPATRVA